VNKTDKKIVPITADFVFQVVVVLNCMTAIIQPLLMLIGFSIASPFHHLSLYPFLYFLLSPFLSSLISSFLLAFF
jgi:hypothetical protein